MISSSQLHDPWAAPSSLGGWHVCWHAEPMCIRVSTTVYHGSRYRMPHLHSYTVYAAVSGGTRLPRFRRAVLLGSARSVSPGDAGVNCHRRYAARLLLGALQPATPA